MLSEKQVEGDQKISGNLEKRVSPVGVGSRLQGFVRKVKIRFPFR